MASLSNPFDLLGDGDSPNVTPTAVADEDRNAKKSQGALSARMAKKPEGGFTGTKTDGAPDNARRQGEKRSKDKRGERGPRKDGGGAGSGGKRVFDRHDGTGRAHENKKGGSGKGNWGKEGEDGKGFSGADAHADAGDEGDEVEEEENENEVSLEEYRKAQADARASLNKVKDASTTDAAEFAKLSVRTSKKDVEDDGDFLGLKKVTSKSQQPSSERRQKKADATADFFSGSIPRPAPRQENSSGRPNERRGTGRGGGATRGGGSSRGGASRGGGPGRGGGAGRGTGPRGPAPELSESAFPSLG